jgi:hypothetical protein
MQWAQCPPQPRRRWGNVDGGFSRSRLQHLIIACLFRGGKLITPKVAANCEGSPRLLLHIARFIRGRQPCSVTKHAEIAALNQLPKNCTLQVLRRTTIVVIRPTVREACGRNRVLCAQPCSECAGILQALGIRRVVYSPAEGAMSVDSPAGLLAKSKPSSGTRSCLLQSAQALGN